MNHDQSNLQKLENNVQKNKGPFKKKFELILLGAWRPKPIVAPKVDPNLTKLSAIERSTEVLRFKLLQLEYSLSPKGLLRGWLKLNVFLCLMLIAPTIFIVPLTTALLSSFVTMSELILTAAKNTLYALIILIIIAITLSSIRSMAIKKRR